MTWSTKLRGLALIAVLSCAQGCGLTALTAALVSSSQSGGGGNAGSQTAPSVSEPQVPDSVTGNLVVSFNLVDAEADPVNITVEMSSDNGATFAAIPLAAVVSGSTQNLAGAPGPVGAPFSFTIDTTNPGLFPGQTINNAQVRLSGTDIANLPSNVATSRSFRIQNNTAPALVLQTTPDDSLQVAINFTVADVEAVSNNPVTGQSVNANPGALIGSGDLAPVSLGLPITPGTFLLRYDNGRVLQDVPVSPTSGRLIGLNGPDPQGGDILIDYTTGSFSGTGSLNLINPGPLGSITADYNQSFVIVTDISYDDQRDGQQLLLPCSPLSPQQATPFPAFASVAGQATTFVWNSLRDIDFGNAQSMAIRVTISDGQTSVSATGNNFLVNNGPLGDLTQIAVNGNTDDLDLGDIDQDGIVDAVVVNSYTPNASFSVFFGDGQSLQPPVVFPIPIPTDVNGQPTLNSPLFGDHPANGLEPTFLVLMDVNNDTFLDAVIGSRGVEPLPQAPDYYSNVFVYFGTGNRATPFDLQNVWGPIPSGGFGVRNLRATDMNSDGVDDLVIVNGYSHDPTVTLSRQPFFKIATAVGAPLNAPNPENTVAPELLAAQTDGAPYVLAGTSLANAPVAPGTLLLVFNGGANTAVDTPLPGNVLGLVLDVSNPTTPIPFSYIHYPSGTFFGDPFNIPPLGLPRLAGILPGATLFANNGNPIANYGVAAPVTLADNINEGSFMLSQLSAGDTITIQGFGHRGFQVISGANVIGPDGQTPGAVINKQAGLLPINATLNFGSDVTTFQDIVNQISSLYSAQVVNPGLEVVSASLDPTGIMRVTLMKTSPGPDSLASPAPRFITTAEVQISDSQGNIWPLFEDSHGNVAVYTTNPGPGGGFLLPNITQEFQFQPPGAPTPVQFFPPSFPPVRNGVIYIPENPNAQGVPQSPGFGTVDDFAPLFGALGPLVPFPVTASTAAGATPSIPIPGSPPGHLSVDPITGNTYTGGFVPGDVAVGDFLPANPVATTPDGFNDFVAACSGDASLVAMVKVPAIVLQGQDPAIDLFFGLFDFLDGLLGTQEVALADQVNTNLFRQGGAAAGAFFIFPNGRDLSKGELRDVDQDGLLDLTFPAGNFMVYARNLIANPPPAPLPPFDVQLAAVGLGANLPDVADFNNDGLLDMGVPILATREMKALIQVPRGNQIISTTPSDGFSAPLIPLQQVEVGRALVNIPTFAIAFTSAGTPMAVIGGPPTGTQPPGPAPTIFSLLLVQNPGPGQIVVNPNVGTLNAAFGTVSLNIPSGTPIDSGLVASYDQLFQPGYVAPNVSLLNFKAISFATGFFPQITRRVDMNNDGLDDAIVMCGLTNDLSILRQNAQVGFDTFVNVSTGISPTNIGSGDFIQGNGLTEVAVVNAGPNTVSIFVPDPVAGLRLVAEVPLVAPGAPLPLLPLGLQIFNIDNDNGPDDLIVTCQAAAGIPVSAGALGFPDPTFRSAFVIIPGNTAAGVAAAQSAGLPPFIGTVVGLGFGASVETIFTDFNNDGTTDIIMTNGGPNDATRGAITAYPNLGGPPGAPPNFANVPDPFNPGQMLPIAVPIEGPFVAPTRLYYSFAVFPADIAAADFNNDGFVDITFGAASGKSLGFGPLGIIPGKDPSIDGLALATDPNGLNGAFLPSYVDISAITEGGSVVVEVSDLNGDGRTDVVIDDLTNGASAGFIINRNSGGPIDILNDFVSFPLQAVALPAGIDVADVNNDGAPDIMISFQGASLVALYINRATADKAWLYNPDNPMNDLPNMFGAPVFLSSGPNTFGAKILDVNGDGKPDLIAASTGASTVNVFFQR